MARWTFTPLGYRPEVDGFRIVPAYAPGLPLLMAAGKWIAGACAVYWIVPLAAGLLVLATFAIGRLVAQPLVGLGAAWLIATSPTMLFMSMAPMSDVPLPRPGPLRALWFCFRRPRRAIRRRRCSAQRLADSLQALPF
jgi:predicted membrane-bound dolichyl-phosphate-mannose-protein mannosyltransferase